MGYQERRNIRNAYGIFWFFIGIVFSLPKMFIRRAEVFHIVPRAIASIGAVILGIGALIAVISTPFMISDLLEEEEIFFQDVAPGTLEAEFESGGDYSVWAEPGSDISVEIINSTEFTSFVPCYSDESLKSCYYTSDGYPGWQYLGQLEIGPWEEGVYEVEFTSNDGASAQVMILTHPMTATMFFTLGSVGCCGGLLIYALGFLVALFLPSDIELVEFTGQIDNRDSLEYSSTLPDVIEYDIDGAKHTHATGDGGVDLEGLREELHKAEEFWIVDLEGGEFVQCRADGPVDERWYEHRRYVSDGEVDIIWRSEGETDAAFDYLLNSVFKK